MEKGADGKLRLRPGRNKIDIDKLTADDLRALGIDPNMSKQDIARALKAKFGDSITITKGGQKVGYDFIMFYCVENISEPSIIIQLLMAIQEN